MRRDAAENHRRILQAAEELFARYGLDATLNDVARKAGLGVGTVYRNFPDKAHLVAALFDELLDEVARIGREALTDSNAGRALTNYFKQTLELQVGNRALGELVHGDPHQRAREFRELIQPLLENLVDNAQQAGALRDDIFAADLVVLQMMLSTLSTATVDLDPQLWRRYLVLILQSLQADPVVPTHLPGNPPSNEQASELVRAPRYRQGGPRE